MKQSVLKIYDLNPDRVKITVNWDKMLPNASVFIPCVNTEKAIKQVKKIANKKGWRIEIHTRIEDKKLGIRLWRIS
tara:strand:+ start:1282 stop:1509 length:228 start_codon:yes stop_codon:yes gene_type:complete